jgi:signal transduction histidine kinase
MDLRILALFVYIFGAYAYTYALLQFRQHRDVGTGRLAPAQQRRLAGASVRLFAMCAVWFVLNSVIEFRALLGEARQNDLIDLAALEIVFLFPAVIFHSYLLESVSDAPPDVYRRWRVVLWGLYAACVTGALYWTGAILGVIAPVQAAGRWIGISIATLFVVMSICALLIRSTYAKRDADVDQQRLRSALNLMFIALIVVFIALNILDSRYLAIVGTSAPLAFLIVSVYYENRIAFYDLVVKRLVLLVIGVLLTGSVLAIASGAVASIPSAGTRAWVLAVLLVPVAMIMPWLHDRLSRTLDRWWFGREFTPVEAIKHVLGAMQQAADESGLISSTEATLSEMFRRTVTFVREGQALPAHAALTIDVKTVSGEAPLRLVVINEPGRRPLLSEDVTMLRSLVSVFGFMLDNVRLQRKRQEQEQLAHELRLRTSRSELKALRAQINPHFLFNALNAIASLIHTDPGRADAAVEQLAEVFRYTLRRSEQDWAPLDQELAFARAYLDVEQARFGRRLEYTIRTEGQVSRAHVPSMLLQTLVENAVKHGISRLRAPGRIEICAREAARRVVLEVRDTGPGPDAEPAARPPAGESFGLRNVQDRLQGHFGTHASLSLGRDAEWTVARIEMPLIEDLSPAGASR